MLAASGQDNPLTLGNFKNYLELTGNRRIEDPATGEDFDVYAWIATDRGIGGAADMPSLVTKERAMSRYAMTGIAVLLGLSMVAACNRSTDLPVTVESVEEKLPALAEAGTAWRPDAYLARASVRLTDDGYASYLIWADFNSPDGGFREYRSEISA